jgi:transcriptional regulator with XRE-family HTH domain
MPTPPNLRELRLRRGWTQEDLAEQCAAKGAPVSRAAIGYIERNGRVPRPKLRLVLAELFEFDVTDFEQAS